MQKPRNFGGGAESYECGCGTRDVVNHRGWCTHQEKIVGVEIMIELALIILALAVLLRIVDGPSGRLKKRRRRRP